MAVVAHLEGGVRAADVHPTVCWAFSCDGGLVHYGAYLALSVEGAGVWSLAVAARFIIVSITAFLYDPGVMAADDPLEVRHTAVAELDCMSINDLL